ncbi:hypothetical protein PROFUN_03934 [Planoprotostelium fungivorum]|uniref:Rab3-GAP regulatory subunit N-terminal domain-containing protein n=1 Tax=Planoprotostelium fungivorum TaxID=1890364 RepID=A0A2P6MTR6_9EUKA|nr:hypothetical protein PROFUN_03934 [Planoprotostelium fungivorum]
MVDTRFRLVNVLRLDLPAIQSRFSSESKSQFKVERTFSTASRGDGWLSECHSCIARDADLIAFGRQDELTLVRSGADGIRIETVNKPANAGDVITQLCIIPILLGDQSYPCIAVGFRSGILRIFNKEGNIILSQMLHAEPILRLKIKSNPSLPGEIGRQSEELIILYPNGVVASVDGLSLYTLIYNYVRGGNYGSSTMDYRKWELKGQDRVNDVITSSIPCDGPLSSLRSPSPTQRIIAAGSHPIVGFYISSGEETRFSTAVALASSVASKLTSAVVSMAINWWSSSAPKEEVKQEEREDFVIEKGISLPLKWSISDPPREVTSLSTDPTGRLAVLTDTFNRVILLDCVHSILLRMWKGYREAQTAFIGCDIGGPSGMLFLAIYAPRRGLLEVWRLRSGERVGAVEVGKGGKLLQTSTPVGSSTEKFVQPRAYFVGVDGRLQRLDVVASNV